MNHKSEDEFEYAGENRWQSVTCLREVDTNLSHMPYTLQYVKQHNLKSPAWCKLHESEKNVWIDEPIELKRNSHGEVLWRRKKKWSHFSRFPSNFVTQFGCFISDNQGEFGGTLETPDGSVLCGNFAEVFDFGKHVYAIDTLAHVMNRHFILYCFFGPSQYKCIYNTDETDDPSTDSKNPISQQNHCFCLDQIYQAETALYILLSGYIFCTQESGPNCVQPCLRLLKVTDSTAAEILTINNASDILPIESMIISDNTLYLSMDKMVFVMDLDTQATKYLTFPDTVADQLLFSPTSRTPLRGVESTRKGANASLPCRQASFNAGNPVTETRYE